MPIKPTTTPKERHSTPETESLRAQLEEAKAQAEYFRHMVEYSEDVLWMRDEHFNFTYLSPAIEKITGYSVEEYLALAPAQRYSEKTRQDLECACKRNDAESSKEHNGEFMRMEAELKHKDGHHVPVEIVCRQQFDPNGVLQGYLGSTRNISRRKAAEREREQTQAQAQLFLNQLDDMVAFHALDGAMTILNRASEAITGYTHKELDENPQLWRDMLHPEDRQEAENFFNTLAGKVESYQTTYRLLNRQGHWKQVELRLFASFDEHGNIDGYFTIERDVTDTLRAEREAEESRANLFALLDAITETAMLLDTEGNVLAVNKVGAKRCGTTPKEMTGKSSYAFIRPEDAKPRYEMLLRAKREGRPIRMEAERDDYLFDIQVTPILGPEGTVDRVAVFASDIAEQRRNQQALERSRKELETVLATIPGKVVVVDADFNILLSSDPEKHILLQGGKYRNKCYHTHHHTEPCPDCPLTTALRTGEPQARLVAAEGPGLEDVKVYAAPIKDEDGKVVGAVKCEMDVSDLGRMERELRRAKLLLEGVFQAIPGMVFFVDTKRRIILASERFQQRFGNLEGTLEPLFCHQAIKSTGEPCSKCVLSTAMETGTIRTRLATPEEEILFGGAHKLFAAPLKDENGEILGAVECIMDVSDLRHMEEELRAAMKTAQQANRAKSEFLATMSHEIRTPLNGVLGMLQLLELTDPDEEQREYITAGLEAGHNLLALLGDILDISRLEAGRMFLRQEAVRMCDLGTSVLSIFYSQAKKKNLELKLTCADDLLQPVMGDEGRLRQVLFNLLGNAVKFTDNGAVELAMDTDGGELRIMVQDTGIGIPPKVQSTIFDPFTQVDGSFQRRHQGAGLGLSIVRRLVELMEGSIDLSSAPGQGSAFTVRLPLRKYTGKAPATEQAAHPQAPTRGALRLLLAEDNRVNQIVTSVLLKKLGHTTVLAENGQEVLNLLEAEHFDVVLMDIQMPVMDGLQATTVIRASGKPFSNIPIIALTAHAMEGDNERLLSQGMDAYLAKPMEADALQAALAKVTDKPGNK